MTFVASDGNVEISKDLTLIFKETKIPALKGSGFKGPTPVVYVKEVNPDGLMLLQFDQKMAFGIEHLDEVNA